MIFRRKVMIILASVTLASCQTGSDTPNPFTPNTPGSIEKQLIDLITQQCKFVPFVSTVTGLIAAFGGPNATPLVNIADAACKQFEKTKPALRSSPNTIYGEVRGIPLRGDDKRQP